FFGHPDVVLVGGDHEAGVGEAGGLLGDGGRDRGVGGADAGDRDAGGQIDERIAVDVDEHPAVGVGGVDGPGGADARRDGGSAAGGERARGRAGQLGDELP